MLDYRLYSFDATGHIVRAPIEFMGASDEEAIETAKRHLDGAPTELWQQSRLVKAFLQMN